MSVWKSKLPVVALREAKGVEVPVGTTKIYVANDKKYGGQEKYHVYQKTAEPGKKAWKFIGTVGAGKADTYLKGLGIEVKDGKPVGMNITKGEPAFVPPPSAEAPKVNIGAAAEPVAPPPITGGMIGLSSKTEQEKYDEKFSSIVDFVKFMEAYSDGTGHVHPTVKAKFPEYFDFGEQDAWEVYDLGRIIRKATSKPEYAGMDVEEFFQQWKKDVGTGVPDDIDDWEMKVKAAAKAYIDTLPKPDPNKVPEPDYAPSSTIQDIWNKSHKDVFANYALGQKPKGVNGEHDEKVLMSMINHGLGTSGESAEAIYKKWTEAHKGLSHEHMSKSYGGKDWPYRAWAIAASISKANGGPGDPEDTETYPNEKNSQQKQLDADKKYADIYSLPSPSSEDVVTGTDLSFDDQKKWKDSFGKEWEAKFALSRLIRRMRDNGELPEPVDAEDAAETWSEKFIKKSKAAGFTPDGISSAYGTSEEIKAVAKALYKTPPGKSQEEVDAEHEDIYSLPSPGGAPPGQNWEDPWIAKFGSDKWIKKYSAAQALLQMKAKGELSAHAVTSYSAAKLWHQAFIKMIKASGFSDNDIESNYGTTAEIEAIARALFLKPPPNPEDGVLVKLKQKQFDQQHLYIFDDFPKSAPTGDLADEWESAYGQDWGNTYAIAKDILSLQKAGNLPEVTSGDEAGNVWSAAWGMAVAQAGIPLDKDKDGWGIENAYGKDWVYKAKAIAKALYFNPPAEKPAAPENDDAFDVEPGFETKNVIDTLHIMMMTVKGQAGGNVYAVPNDVAAELEKQYGADWKKTHALASTIHSMASKELVFDIAAQLPAFEKSMVTLYGSNWKKKAAAVIANMEEHPNWWDANKNLPINLPPPETTPTTPTPPIPTPPAVVSEPEEPPKKVKKKPGPKPGSKKKKKDLGFEVPPAPTGGYTPPPGTPPADLPIPHPSQLTLKGSGQHLGGAGQKQFYTDSAGNEYLFKIASKKGSGAEDPPRAFVQSVFSKIAKKIKPAHPTIEVTKLGGKVGAIYPFLKAGKPPGIEGQSPAQLTAQERQDIAEEHVIDWLMSQHDSHKGNFLRTEDGRIVGIDKEQGYKYFGSDSLDIDYHPNGQYGEDEPYYNKFWRDWSESKFEFDPVKLTGAIEKAMAIPGKEFRATVAPYAQARFPGNKLAQDAFVQEALNRKNTLKRDFEKFLDGLHKKKLGGDGTFTFEKGWSTADKPYVKKTHHPEKIETATEKLSALGGKVVAHSTDPNLVTVKTSSDETAFKKMLEDLGFGGASVKVGSHYKMAFVDKKKWEDAKITTPAWDEEETIYPSAGNIPPSPSKPAYLPKVSPHTPVKPNSKFFSEITKKTNLGVGTGVTLDGPAVEHQRARVVRRKDSDGTYYEVSFKLRDPIYRTIKGGTSASFVFYTGTYNEKTDTLSSSSSMSDNSNSRVWRTEGGNEIHVMRAANEKDPYSGATLGKFAYQGLVVAKVRSPDVGEGLAKLLAEVQPGLDKKVLRDPTEEDAKIAALSSALYALAPQKSDRRAKEEAEGTWERTLDNLEKDLKPHLTKDQMEEIGHVDVQHFASAVMPGRWKTLGGGTENDPAARFLFWEVSTPDKVVNMFKSVGAAGILERNFLGIDKFGASYEDDVGSGCAAGMTVRVATSNNDHTTAQGHYGNIRVIVAPDELDRLDSFLHKGDAFGCMNPNHPTTGWATSYKNRKNLDEALKNSTLGDELVVRQMLPKGKILRVAVDTEQGRKALISAFKKEGLVELNGVPVEDFVVTSGGRNVKQIYETYVKPAGY